MIRVELLEKHSEAEWGNFVAARVTKEYGFTLEWRELLVEVFRYKDFYYLIKKDEELIGIFPVFLVKSRLLGDRLISLPFLDMGGFYFLPSLTDEIKIEAFHKTIERLKADSARGSRPPLSLEIRNPCRDSNEFLATRGMFIKNSPYLRFIIRLDTSWECIAGKFSRNIKRNLAKAGNQLEISICRDKSLLADIYEIYLVQMQILGSPPLPFAYFKKLWEKFYPNGDLIIFTARHRKRLVGAISLVAFKRHLYADLIMSNTNHDYLGTKIQLYLASLKYAWSSKRYDFYDFNRTRPGSGVFLHKSRWGGATEEICCFFQDARQLKQSFFDISQRRFRIMSKVLRVCPRGILRQTGGFFRGQIAK